MSISYCNRITYSSKECWGPEHFPYFDTNLLVSVLADCFSILFLSFSYHLNSTRCAPCNCTDGSVCNAEKQKDSEKELSWAGSLHVPCWGRDKRIFSGARALLYVRQNMSVLLSNIESA